MTTRHETDRRTRVITDLRSLADYLAAYPQIPVPRLGCIRISVHPLYDTDAATESEAIAEVERVAALLNVPVTVEGGHHVATKEFGTVSYEVTVVTEEAHARSRARRSYENAIVLDQGMEL
jgi:hypothetical protein